MPNVKVGQEITLGSTNDIELTVLNVSPDYDQVAWVVISAGNTGTIQVAVGEVISGSAQKANAAGEKFPLTFRPGQQTIHVKGTNGADKLTLFV